MKKINKTIFLFLFLLLSLTGCSKIFNTEIYNKSYNVGEISITEFEDLIVAVVEKASPAVIGVSHLQKNSYLPGIYKTIGTGSGVIYKGIAHLKDGSTMDAIETIERQDVEIYEYYFITNRHVVVTDNLKVADQLEVHIGADDEYVDASLIQWDPQVDIAVGKFEYTKYIRPLEFADSEQIKAGSFAIAIGSPSGHDYYGSATFGIVSFPKRYIAETNSNGISDWDAEYIQHDVAINPGNSGGPLLNIKGQIIGINTMKFLSDDIDNMGFSIPSNLVVTIIDVLEQGIQPQRAKLGIQAVSIRDLNQEQLLEYNIPEGIKDGIYIDQVLPDGVAIKAKLRSGDIIMSFENETIRYSYQIRAILNRFVIGSGQVATMQIYRDGELVEIKLVF